MDIQYTKIPIFEDVNDTPVVPTATNAGNGSHFIRQYHQLIDETESSINTLESDVNLAFRKLNLDWVVVQNDYIATPGDKVVFKTNAPLPGKTTYYLNLPSSPPLGTNITFINTNLSITIEIRNFGRFNGDSPIRIYTKDSYKTRTLVHAGTDIGWIPTTPDDYTKEFPNT
jgi:hypothetical protein